MGRKCVCVCVSVCVCVLFKEFLRAMERFFSPEKKKLENTTNVILFSEHKNYILKVVFISSCIFIK